MHNPSTYTLYYAPGAASMLVHWLLIELEQPYELKALDLQAGEQKHPDYLALNPGGVVPTLVHEGRPMVEAAAIAMQLADEHPDAGLAPPVGDARRAAYYQWMLHLANAVQPLFRIWWYPHEVLGQATSEETRSHVQPRIEAAWDRVDAHLAAHGPYLLGDRAGTPDFYLTMLMRWSRNMPRPATSWPHLAALAVRMKARPTFAELYEREGLTDWS
jgi:glutathione S-transferase